MGAGRGEYECRGIVCEKNVPPVVDDACSEQHEHDNGDENQSNAERRDQHRGDVGTEEDRIVGPQHELVWFECRLQMLDGEVGRSEVDIGEIIRDKR